MANPSKKVHRIVFKHLDGSQKFIPGVSDYNVLAPKMIETKLVVNGVESMVQRKDESHLCRIALLDEDIEVELSDNQKKLPERVQEKILERRVEEVDFAMQANNSIRRVLKEYERNGSVEIINMDEVVEEKKARDKGAVVLGLSEIALADFADRGIPIPDHLRGADPELKTPASKK